jgi:hypothetical protein
MTKRKTAGQSPLIEARRRGDKIERALLAPLGIAADDPERFEMALALLLADDAIFRKVEALAAESARGGGGRPRKITSAGQRALARAVRRWRADDPHRETLGAECQAKRVRKHFGEKFAWATRGVKQGQVVENSPKQLADTIRKAEAVAEKTRAAIRLAASIGRKRFAGRRPALLIAEAMCLEALRRLYTARRDK